MVVNTTFQTPYVAAVFPILLFSHHYVLKGFQVFFSKTVDLSSFPNEGMILMLYGYLVFQILGSEINHKKL